MATKVNINGKLVSLPGVYTLIKSGIQNPPVNLPYGAVCIIDDGIGESWGAGIGGQAYTFTTIQDFRNFVKGGPLWDLALPLFKPVSNQTIQGVSSVILIQARDTVAATITLTLLNSTIVLTTIDQGENANGMDQGFTGALKTGYAATFEAGKTNDTYIMKLWHGSYTDQDPLNLTPYNGVSVANSAPVLLAQSPELLNAADLLVWLNTDQDVKAGFTNSVDVTTSGGDFVTADITTGFVMAVGGTENYSPTAWTAATVKAKQADFEFILALDYSADSNSANNDSILSDVIVPSRYGKQMVVGGYEQANELTSSIAAAQHFNSDNVILIHGDGLSNASNNQFKQRSPLWKAANVLGRLCGLEPQTPLTFKKTGIDSESNPIDQDQQELALAGGVLTTYFDTEFGYDVILQGINTLQDNEFLVNDDGSSFSIAVKRITFQLNKEIAIFLKKKFFGNDTSGPNRNTVTDADLIAATEGYLQKRTASSNQDSLIIRFQNITATVTSDTYYVNYEFVPNFEVNKIIVTGLILDK